MDKRTISIAGACKSSSGTVATAMVADKARRTAFILVNIEIKLILCKAIVGLQSNLVVDALFTS